MGRSFSFFIVFLFLFSALSLAYILPQSASGTSYPVSVVGYAFDGAGGRIAGVSVTVQLTDLGASKSTTTNEELGSYFCTWWFASPVSSNVLVTGSYYGHTAQNTSYLPSPTTLYVDLHFDIYPPEAPTDLRATQVGDDILLEWTPSTSPDVDHYNIYISQDANTFDFGAPNASTALSNWTHVNACLNVTDHYYVVRAVNDIALEERNRETVGKYRLSVSPGWSLVSLPLEPFNSSVNSVLCGYLSGGEYQSQSDRLLNYNSTSLQWEVAWKFESETYPQYNGTWFFGGQPFSVSPHRGYWVHIRDELGHSGQVINLTGRVLRGVQSVPLVEGWNLIGYVGFEPAVIDLGELDTTGLVASGFTGGQYQSGSDRILSYTAGLWQVNWLYNATVYPEYNGRWYGDCFDLQAGRGYWIQIRSGHDGFDWQYPI